MQIPPLLAREGSLLLDQLPAAADCRIDGF